MDYISVAKCYFFYKYCSVTGVRPFIFISIVLNNTIILIREGGTVFDFRRLQRFAIAQVASSLVVEYSPVTFILISAVSLRVFTAEYIFCVLFSRSGGSSLLVCTLPRRGEIIYEGILSLCTLFIHRRRKKL